MTPDDASHASRPGVRSELAVYFRFAFAVLRPGHAPRGFPASKNSALTVGDLDGWPDSDIDLLLDEGRRRLDAQAERFDRIRQTAQVVLPLATALAVVVGRTAAPIHARKAGCTEFTYLTVYGLSLGCLFMSVFGSAALLVVKATFGSVLPTLVSQGEPPVAKALARAYAEQSVIGEHTINTRLTLQWWSVLFLVAGGVIYVVLWLALNW